MSASREKQARKAAGAVPPKTAREAQQRKEEQRTRLMYGAVGIALAVAIVASILWNSNIIARSATAVTIDGKNYSAAEVSFYYRNAYMGFVNQWNYFLSYFGLDTSTPLESQLINETAAGFLDVEEGTVWKDYFMDQGLEQIASVQNALKQAEEENFQYPDSVQEDLSEAMDSLSENARSNGVSVGRYLRSLFGAVMTERVYRSELLHLLQYDAYSNAYHDALDYTEEELQAKYDEDPNAYDLVSYELVTIDGAPPEETATDADTPDAAETDTADDAEAAVADTEAETDTADDAEAEDANAADDADAEQSGTVNADRSNASENEPLEEITAEEVTDAEADEDTDAADDTDSAAADDEAVPADDADEELDDETIDEENADADTAEEDTAAPSVTPTEADADEADEENADADTEEDTAAPSVTPTEADPDETDEENADADTAEESEEDTDAEAAEESEEDTDAEAAEEVEEDADAEEVNKAAEESRQKAREKAEALLARFHRHNDSELSRWAADVSGASYTQESESTYDDANAVSTVVSEWLFDADRTDGDAEILQDGDMFYVAVFYDRFRDEEKTVDVRHILIQPEEVPEDDADELTDEELEALTEEERADYEAEQAEREAAHEAAEEQANADAKAEAERIYAEWQDGEATEESFAALAKEYTADSNGDAGGLYRRVYVGQMVEAFNDWCFHPKRVPGDTGIVETDYGYHIMYFVGDDLPRWEAQIFDDLQSEDYSEWTESLTADAVIEKHDFGMSFVG